MIKETYAAAVYRLDLAAYEKREAAHLRDYEQKKARLAADHKQVKQELEQLIAEGKGDSRFAKNRREYLRHIEHFQRQADDMWANRRRSKPPTPPNTVTTEKWDTNHVDLRVLRG